MGVAKGELVGLSCPSSPLWIMTDLAIQIAGGVTVPFCRKISEDDFAYQLRDSSVRSLFVGNPQAMPVECLRAASRVKSVGFWHSGRFPAFEAILRRGRALNERDPGLFARLCAGAGEHSLATVLYTSGTTGLPRAVELTQANIVSQVIGCAERFPADPERDVRLSVLPLDHIFERMVMYYYFSAGLPVYFVDDPGNLAQCLVQVRPTIMTAVPRLLEKIAHRFEDKVSAERGLRGVLARAALSRAARREIGRASFNPLDLLFRATVHPRIAGALGGRLRLVMSGSSRLQPEVARLLINLGVPVFEGYGLTEASPVVAASYAGRRKPGTVGPGFPGVEISIAEDGEILVRGPNVMRGYRRDRRATADAITPDGWLRTGDIGSLDAEGFLTVERRKKEMFKKSTGEYVAPLPLEKALERIPFVDTAVIVADDRPFVAALLFLNPQEIEKLRDQERDSLERSAQGYIDRLNTGLPHCERVERFILVPHPARVETGELTPTLKPRRAIIESIYHGDIEAMYRSGGSVT